MYCAVSLTVTLIMYGNVTAQRYFIAYCVLVIYMLPMMTSILDNPL